MRFLFLKAFVGLLAYDLFGCGQNFAQMHKFVSRWKVASRTVPPDAVEQVSKAVNFACAMYLKGVLCLQRSAVTTCLLRSCGVPAQMVIGAQRLPFKAHAWTEVNGLAINERRNVQSIYGIWDRC